jgi:hypothetical protein
MQLQNIEAIEKRLWEAADTLRTNTNYARPRGSESLIYQKRRNQ